MNTQPEPAAPRHLQLWRNTMTKMIRLSLPFALALVACGGLGGTDGGSGNGDMAQNVTVEPRLSSLYQNYLGSCKSCHAPGAPGRTAMMEQTLDFTSATTAFTTLTTGKAAGLVGNQADCNTVPFVISGKPAQSLIVAVVDQPTRVAFDYPMAAKCDSSEITDETVKQGFAPPDTFVAALKQWITDGASNN